MLQTVIGIFNDADKAQSAVDHLLDDGFDETNVDFAKGSGRYADKHNDGNNNESGISRFFKNLFGDHSDSDRYTNAAQKGYIVTVHATSTDEARRASLLLDEYGAEDIDEDNTDYMRQYGNTTGIPNPESGTGFNHTSNRDDLTEANKDIPVMGENQQVGKSDVEMGSLQRRSRIVEKPVEETIRLREERVRIDRNNVDRPENNE